MRFERLLDAFFEKMFPIVAIAVVIFIFIVWRSFDTTPIGLFLDLGIIGWGLVWTFDI